MLELEKSKQELQEEYSKNKALIKNYRNDIKVLNANTFENKLSLFLFTSVITYVINMSIMLFLKSPSIFGLSPFVSFPLVTIGGSLLISIPFNHHAFKNFKKALNKITDAKTQKEMLLEKTNRELEVERLKSKNKALGKAIELLSNEEDILNNIKGNYEVTEKKEENQDEVFENANNLLLKLKDKEEEVKITSTQNYLRRRFLNVRSKSSRLLDLSVNTIMSSMFSMIILSMPLATPAIFHNFQAYHSINPFIFSLASILTPIALCVTGTVLYSKNLLNKERKVFRKINNGLGKNSLSKDEKSDEMDMNMILESKVDELSHIILEEKKSKRSLESIAMKTGDATTIKDKNEIVNTNNLERTDYMPVGGPRLVKNAHLKNKTR